MINRGLLYGKKTYFFFVKLTIIIFHGCLCGKMYVCIEPGNISICQLEAISEHNSCAQYIYEFSVVIYRPTNVHSMYIKRNRNVARFACHICCSLININILRL